MYHGCTVTSGTACPVQYHMCRPPRDQTHFANSRLLSRPQRPFLCLLSDFPLDRPASWPLMPAARSREFAARGSPLVTLMAAHRSQVFPDSAHAPAPVVGFEVPSNDAGSGTAPAVAGRLRSSDTGAARPAVEFADSELKSAAAARTRSSGSGVALPAADYFAHPITQPHSVVRRRCSPALRWADRPDALTQRARQAAAATRQRDPVALAPALAR